MSPEDKAVFWDRWNEYIKDKKYPSINDSHLKWNLPQSVLDIDILDLCSQSMVDKGLTSGEYQDRLMHEYNIIDSRNMWNLVKSSLFIKDAVERTGQVLSSGRGSSCASLLFYLLDVNAVDPIKYDIGFDYFLPADRPDKKPDVDMEVADNVSVRRSFGQFQPVLATKFERMEIDGVKTDEWRQVNHPSGLYFQNMPVRGQKLLNRAALPHRVASKEGFLKHDLLNSVAFSMVSDLNERDELIAIAENDFPWDDLSDKRYYDVYEGKDEDGELIVKHEGELVQLHSNWELIEYYNPRSIEDLAMLLAVLRPAKYELIGKSWDAIRDSIWLDDKGDNLAYAFKRPHAIATAINVCVHLLTLWRRDNE